MPPKKLQNRIDSLFADLKAAQDEGEELPESPSSVSGMESFTPPYSTEKKETAGTSPSETGPSNAEKMSVPVSDPSNLAEHDGDFIVSRPLSPQGWLSLQKDQPVYLNASASDKNESSKTDSPAVMAVPIPKGNVKGALLEALDHTPNRIWTDDERRLVEQVTDQLSLALENAYLFQRTQAALAKAEAIALENSRLYKEQLVAAEKLRELDQLKSLFLANISHELRTPLNSIIGFSRVLLKGIDGPISQMQEQDITAIHNAGTHLLDIINDILDISRIETGKLELAFEENVDLVELVNSTLKTAEGLIKGKPIQFERVFEPELPKLRIDPTRIRQVLFNLISNAVKFSTDGLITVLIFQRNFSDNGKTPQRDEVIISVKDNGPGISKDDQMKLFRPFSQVEPSRTRKVEGSGLGLYISRLLVELHQGSIGVESQLEHGATFYFTLPLD